MTYTNKLYSILLVLFGTWLFASPVKAGSPSLLFSDSVLNTTGDSEIVATIVLDTAGIGVSGAGARLVFDPYYLTAVRVEPTNIFADYPATIIDNSKGTITISGIVSSPTDLFNGQGNFADIIFHSFHPGTSKINFLFTPGSTTDSNIAVMTGNGDVLSQVNELTINTSISYDNADTIDSVSTPTPTPAAVISLLKSQNGLVKKIASTFGLSKVADQYASARPGRSAISDPAEPMAPITRQDPITDPSTTQQLTSTINAVKVTPPGYIIPLLIVFIVILLGIVIWFLLKQRELPPPPTTNVPVC